MEIALGNLMVPLAQLSLALSWIVGLFAMRSQGSARYLGIIILICFTMVFLEFLFVHKGVNATIAGSQPLSTTEITTLLGQWKVWHWIRVVLGFVGFSAGILLLFFSR